MDQQIRVEDMFSDKPDLISKLEGLKIATNPSCIVIDLGSNLECQIRAKIDPKNNYRGCLIIIRLKTERPMAAVQQQILGQAEAQDHIEVDRNCTLIEAVEAISKHLIQKYSLKQNQLLDKFIDQEGLANQLEEENKFENTVLEDYLINHKLRSSKKSILFVNMNTISGGSQDIYRNSIIK